MSETPRYTDKETGRSTPHAQEIADILGQRQELKDIITQNNFPKKNELNWGNEGSPYEIKASDTKGVLEILKNTDGFNAKSQLNDTRYVQIAYWNMMTHMKTLPAQDANGKFYDVNSIEAGDKIFVKNGFLHFKRKEGSSFADFEVPIYPWDVTLPSADKETETAPDLRKVGQELKIEEAIASGLIVQDETGDWNPIEGYEFIDPSDTSANWGVKPKEQAQAPVETQSSPEQKWNESVQKIVNDFKDKTVEPGRSENPFGPNLTGDGVSFAEAGGWTSFDPVVKGSENWTSDQITRAIKDLNKEWVKTHPAAAPEAPAGPATEPAAPAATEPAAAPTAPAAAAGTGPKYPLPEY